jgi:hypothetical protein
MSCSQTRIIYLCNHEIIHCYNNCNSTNMPHRMNDDEYIEELCDNCIKLNLNIKLEEKIK